jgi:hypothetical protein
VERSRPRRAAARGAASARWLLVALAAGVLGLLALLALALGRDADGRDARRGPLPEPASAAAADEAAVPVPLTSPAAPVDARGTETPAQSSSGTEGRAAEGSRFELVAVAPPESAFTGAVRVTLRRAGELERELQLPPDAPQVEVVCADVEYVLEAHHHGPPELASLPLVLLVDGDMAEPVRLTLVPARVLAGTVTEVSGRAVVDVPLALELGDRPAATARSGADGGFLFAPLAEGEYELVVGDPLGPLVPRRAVHLEAGLGVLDVVVPPLHEVVVRVVDEQGLALPDVEVEGLGQHGGRVAGVTDARGELHARGLPPGDYRLFARDPVLGRGTRVFALSSASPVTSVEIRLVPRR